MKTMRRGSSPRRKDLVKYPEAPALQVDKNSEMAKQREKLDAFGEIFKIVEARGMADERSRGKERLDRLKALAETRAKTHGKTDCEKEQDFEAMVSVARQPLPPSPPKPPHPAAPGGPLAEKQLGLSEDLEWEKDMKAIDTKLQRVELKKLLQRQNEVSYLKLMRRSSPPHFSPSL
eukprot:TRINITY_DN6217_c0_g1_i1.p1 TRINITY_DN6217_c0_g1~~TRINITY_DN6217_c0_g1_i1.p1  ORF type:complete len:176 (+),score=28.60 TRINITY_DN6217_c0_g1_i1:325-852(+)